MLAIMNRKEFESLGHVALGMACNEPTIRQIHRKDMDVKARVYSELTEGQQALMMFWVLHGHVGHSAVELFAWVDYLLREEPRTWSALQTGLRYLGDVAMLRLLVEVEGRDESAQEQLHAQYHELADQTQKRIAEYIRNHPGEFVEFED